jgi:hypothetical protein
MRVTIESILLALTFELATEIAVSLSRAGVMLASLSHGGVLMRIPVRRAVIGCSLIAGLLAPQMIFAQNPYDPWQDRYGRDGRYDAYTRPARLEAGTFITVRIERPLASDRADGRLVPAVVDRDVWDQYGRLAVPVIPQGSPAQLRVRTAPDGDLILDLDSVVVDGRRYAVDAQTGRIDSRPRGTSGRRSEEYGDGSLLGTIIGSIAGTGAGDIATRGRQVRVPAGSTLTFRLERDLRVGGRAFGYRRNR